MSTNTNSLWPRKIEVPRDPILAFLRGQALDLTDLTDGLLEGHLETTYVDGIEVEVTFYVRPVNGFLHNMAYALMRFRRKIEEPFPFFVIFHPWNIDETYSTEPLEDLQQMTAAVSRGFQTERTTIVLDNMIRFVKGLHDENI